MIRLVRVIVMLLGVVVFLAWGALRANMLERLVLDDAARAAAPGKFVRLSAGVTHYEMTGPDSARTVALVHGFSVPMYIWDSTVVALTAAGYRVLRYDVFGRGWSDRPDAAYDGPFFARQLDELLDSLHVTGPVDLIGLSYGGFITGHYVPAHASRVRTLTLIDPVATPRELPWFLSLPAIGPWIWQVAEVPGMADNQASDFLHPERFPDWADRYRPQMQYQGFGRALLRSAFTVERVRYSVLYAGVASSGVPVLLIWGRQDQTVPFERSEFVRRAIPALEFFPVDSAGHLPHMEQPGPVHVRVRAFLEAHP